MKWRPSDRLGAVLTMLFVLGLFIGLAFLVGYLVGKLLL